MYYDRTAVISPVVGALKYGHMTSSGAWAVEVVDSNAPITLPTNTCGGGATSAACIGAPNVAVPTSPFQIYDIKHLVTSGVSTPVIAYVYGSGGASSSTTGKSVHFGSQKFKWRLGDRNRSDGSSDLKRDSRIHRTSLQLLSTQSKGSVCLSMTPIGFI